MSAAGIIMDLVLMVLLLGALGFGVRLNMRLKALKSGQEAFAEAVSQLDQAAIRAHQSLKSLRGEADESQELLHGRILAARDLLTRLEQQIDQAERTQKDLQTGLSNAVMVGSLSEDMREETEASDHIVSPSRIRRQDWASSRTAEAKRSYANPSSEAMEANKVEAYRDLNDRFDQEASHQRSPEAEVSEIGLKAISELVRSLSDKAVVPQPVVNPASRRSRLPQPLEADLFETVTPQNQRPEREPNDDRRRPLFRRTR
jgi:hypothetical protein